jgi:hypothetical protein
VLAYGRERLLRDLRHQVALAREVVGISPVLDSPAWLAMRANDVFAYPTSAMVSIAAATICARRPASVNVRADPASPSACMS